VKFLAKSGVDKTLAKKLPPTDRALVYHSLSVIVHHCEAKKISCASGCHPHLKPCTVCKLLTMLSNIIQHVVK